MRIIGFGSSHDCESNEMNFELALSVLGWNHFVWIYVLNYLKMMSKVIKPGTKCKAIKGFQEFFLISILLLLQLENGNEELLLPEA